MFSKEIMAYLVKLISSWQIIAVTAALFLYFKLVFYVANARRPRNFDFSSKPKTKQKKEKAAEKQTFSSDDDELGLS